MDMCKKTIISVSFLIIFILGIRVKVYSCNPPQAPVNTTKSANLTICNGNSAKLSATGIGKLGWYTAATGGTYLGGDTNLLTPTLLYAGTSTFYVQDSTCAASTTRTAITVTVLESPNADFTNDPACSRYKINFKWTGYRPAWPVITTYSWNFNGKDTSTLMNPSILLDTGFKKVTLSLTSSNGCMDSVSKILLVRPQAKADFTVNPNCENDPASFVNLSQGAQTYQWKFGDAATSNTQSPKHFFRLSGETKIFQVCLYAMVNNGCTDSICKLDTVFANPKSDFNFTINGQSVDFKATEPGNTMYKWMFGNGDSSTIKDIVYKYPKSGQYDACLQVKNAAGCYSKTCESFSVPCNARFSRTGDTSQKFKVFLINNSTNTTTTTYQWDFGDGGSSTLRNPAHSYSKFGKFKVCLTISDSGCTSMYCDTIGMDSTGKLFKASTFELVLMEGNLSVAGNKGKADFAIYPNPTAGKITVDLRNSLANYERLEVIDAIGQVCTNLAIESGSRILELDLSKLNPGLYFIKISINENNSYLKIIKK